MLADRLLNVWIYASVFGLVVLLPLVVTPWTTDYHRSKVLVLYTLTALIIFGSVASYLVLRKHRWRVTAPELPLWGFMFFLLASAGASSNIRATIFGAPARYEGLLAWLSYGVLFFVGVHFFGTRGGFQRLARVATATALAVIAFALVQAFSGVSRPASTMGNPFVLGGYLTLTTPVALGLGLTAHDQSRYVWLATASMGLAVVTMTLTRAAWLASLVGAGILLAGLGRDTLRRKGRVLIAVLLGVVLVDAVWMTTVVKVATVVERGASSLDLESGSLAQRIYIWKQTASLIRAKPLLGWGLGTLGQVFPYDRSSLVEYFGPRPVIIDKAHNQILQVAVSTGIPGAVAYLALWTVVILAALRTWRGEAGDRKILAAAWLAAIVGYLVQIQFSFSVVGLAPLVWLFAGAAAGWDSAIHERRTTVADERVEGGLSPLQP